MMTFEEFQYYIEDNILTHWMPGAEVSLHTIQKNNGVKRVGLYIKKEEEKAAPVIYLDDYYEYYLKGEELDVILKKIQEEYFWAMERMTAYHLNINKFEDIKSKLFYRLVNYQKNQDMLAYSPYIRLYDLAVTFRWLAHQDNIGISTALITNQELALWGVSFSELLLAARVNTPVIFPASIMEIDDFLKKSGKKLDYVGLDIPMYVMTNTKQINGATVLVYEGVLQQFAAKMKTDFYILPSSIHEMILIPAMLFDDADYLFQIVREANKMLVSPGDVLSDSIYYYDFGKNSIIPLTKERPSL